MKDDILSLWLAHRQAALPDVPRESMGELWVLDEVIGGCVNFYLQAGGALDAPRKAPGYSSRPMRKEQRKAGQGQVDDHLGTCNSEACPLPWRRRISKAFDRALG